MESENKDKQTEFFHPQTGEKISKSEFKKLQKAEMRKKEDEEVIK